MQTRECIVIGGGLIGLLTAYELSSAGIQVRILERGLVGRESSWAGGGILSPLHPWLTRDDLVPMVDWSQTRYPEFARELYDQTDIDPEWTRSGLLVLVPEDMGLIEDWACRTGRQYQTLSGTEIRETEPYLAPDLNKGVLLPEVAQIRNPRLLKALVAGLEKRGVSIQEHSEIREIDSSRSGEISIVTREETLTAECVVVASGAWSGRLLKMAGIDVHVEPVRGQMLLFKSDPGLLKSILIRGDRYMIPRRDGHILMGSTVEYEGYDKSTTLDVAETLAAEAAKLLPHIASLHPEAHWAGLRPGTDDGIPKIGPVPGVEGLFVNVGHLRNGVLLAPASARLLADQILGRAPIIDPTPYRITN